MRHYKDMTYYSHLHYENSKNIGWLSADCPYSKGKVSDEFINCLWEYLRTDFLQAREYYGCQLCNDQEKKAFIATHNYESKKLGFAEIRVLSENGSTLYAAPNLIYHYIVDHEYRPPEEFIQAVLNGPKPGTFLYESFLSSCKEYTVDGLGMDEISIVLWGENTELTIKLTEKMKEAIIDENETDMNTLISSFEPFQLLIPLSKWLYIAALLGKIRSVDCFISHQVEADICKPSSNPLFAAIAGGHIEIVKLLIKSGIDVKIRYSNEFMKNLDAITFAKKKGQDKIAEFLLATEI